MQSGEVLSIFLIRVAVKLVSSDKKNYSNVLYSSALALKNDFRNSRLPMAYYKIWLDESSKSLVALFNNKTDLQEIKKIAKKQAVKLLRKHSCCKSN